MNLTPEQLEKLRATLDSWKMKGSTAGAPFSPEVLDYLNKKSLGQSQPYLSDSMPVRPSSMPVRPSSMPVRPSSMPIKSQPSESSFRPEGDRREPVRPSVKRLQELFEYEIRHLIHPNFNPEDASSLTPEQLEKINASLEDMDRRKRADEKRYNEARNSNPPVDLSSVNPQVQTPIDPNTPVDPLRSFTDRLPDLPIGVTKIEDTKPANFKKQLDKMQQLLSDSKEVGNEKNELESRFPMAGAMGSVLEAFSRPSVTQAELQAGKTPTDYSTRNLEAFMQPLQASIAAKQSQQDQLLREYGIERDVLKNLSDEEKERITNELLQRRFQFDQYKEAQANEMNRSILNENKRQFDQDLKYKYASLVNKSKSKKSDEDENDFSDDWADQIITGNEKITAVPVKYRGKVIQKINKDPRTRTKQNMEFERGTTMLANVGEALKLVSPTSTGYTGIALSKIPNTNAYDLSRLIQPIKSIMSVEQLNQMRAASPTGGAMGQVSDRDIVLLQSLAGNLDLNQSENRLRTNLIDLNNSFVNVIYGSQKELEDLYLDGKITLEEIDKVNKFRMPGGNKAPFYEARIPKRDRGAVKEKVEGFDPDSFLRGE